MHIPSLVALIHMTNYETNSQLTCKTISIANKLNTTINFLNYSDLFNEILYLGTNVAPELIY